MARWAGWPAVARAVRTRRALAAGALLTAVLIAAMTACAREAPPCVSTATGALRTHTLTSRVYGNTRLVQVLRPPGYDTDGDQRRYPVLVLLDGQNVFDACRSASGQEWRLDEVVDSLVAARALPPVLVVAVDHGGEARAREYLPYRDERQMPQLVDMRPGQQFPAFLVDEVLPLVRRAYRTDDRREATAIGGSSYGAVAALYALNTRADVFGLALLESAPFWVGHEQLLRDVAASTAAPVRVWMGAGGNETDDAEEETLFLRDTHGVIDALRARGLDSTRLRYRFVPAGTHSERAWAARVGEAMTFLFGAPGSAGAAPRASASARTQ